MLMIKKHCYGVSLKLFLLVPDWCDLYENKDLSYLVFLISKMYYTYKYDLLIVI